MKTKHVLPVALGVLALSMPVWAQAPSQTPPDGSSLLSLDSTDAEAARGASPQQQLTAKDIAEPYLSTEELTPTVSDALPMMSFETRTMDTGIGLLVAQTAVGPDTVATGVGIMLTITGQQSKGP